MISYQLSYLSGKAEVKTWIFWISHPTKIEQSWRHVAYNIQRVKQITKEAVAVTSGGGQEKIYANVSTLAIDIGYLSYTPDPHTWNSGLAYISIWWILRHNILVEMSTK